MFKLSRRAAPAIPEPPAAAEATDEPAGCGWFDSSHELQRGLLVHEHTSLAELSVLLPLPDWLDLHLSGWRPQA
jgi:hypothetical protein